MKPEILQAAVRAVPFRPFRLILASGERLAVPKSHYLWLQTGNDTVAWTNEHNNFKLLDVGLLLGIELEGSA